LRMPADSASPGQPATLPPGRSAWLPFTPRGVAAFASASLGRLLLVEIIIALLVAGTLVWFLANTWLPTIRRAIHQLPDQGIISQRKLASPLATASTLAETRPFLLIVVDLEKQRNASQTSDVLVEFHRNNVQVCAVFGCLLFEYPEGWTVEFNRQKLEPWWDAWEPIILGLAAPLTILILLVSWALLATIYCSIVRLLGFFKDRDLNWRRSWRLASASLMPGAVLLAGGLFGYGLGIVDLFRLLLVFVLHLATGWVYLAISPVFVARLPIAAPRSANPFTTDQKPDR